jgi:hypothetical protein
LLWSAFGVDDIELSLEGGDSGLSTECGAGLGGIPRHELGEHTGALDTTV